MAGSTSPVEDGLKLYEALTLISIFLGPIIAVSITLLVEHFRRKREGRLVILRMLLTSRVFPGDPSWNMAINMIPAEFGNDEKVMTALKEFHDAARVVPTQGQEAIAAQNTTIKSAALIHRVMQTLGMNAITEGQLQTDGYASSAWVQREGMYLDSLRALRDLANTMHAQHELLKSMSRVTSDTDLQASRDRQIPR